MACSGFASCSWVFRAGSNELMPHTQLLNNSSIIDGDWTMVHGSLLTPHGQERGPPWPGPVPVAAAGGGGALARGEPSLGPEACTMNHDQYIA